jgi:hypothetical protein
MADAMGRTLATSDDGATYLWDIATHRIIAIVPDISDAATRGAVSRMPARCRRLEEPPTRACHERLLCAGMPASERAS